MKSRLFYLWLALCGLSSTAFSMDDSSSCTARTEAAPTITLRAPLGATSRPSMSKEEIDHWANLVTKNPDKFDHAKREKEQAASRAAGDFYQSVEQLYYSLRNGHLTIPEAADQYRTYYLKLTTILKMLNTQPSESAHSRGMIYDNAVCIILRGSSSPAEQAAATAAIAAADELERRKACLSVKINLT